MTTESESFVPRVWPGTYRLPPARLHVPADALRYTLDAFQRGVAIRVESACFWYGSADDNGGGMVEAVVVPPQESHPRWYRVTAAAMQAVSRATAPRGWRNLAQLHNHPGPFVEHSFYDDDNANSRRALSLVLPFYGAGPDWPQNIGVHDFQDGAWHLLSPADASARIIIEATGPCELVDLR